MLGNWHKLARFSLVTVDFTVTDIVDPSVQEDAVSCHLGRYRRVSLKVLELQDNVFLGQLQQLFERQVFMARLDPGSGSSTVGKSDVDMGQMFH